MQINFFFLAHGVMIWLNFDGMIAGSVSKKCFNTLLGFLLNNLKTIWFKLRRNYRIHIAYSEIVYFRYQNFLCSSISAI